MPALLGGLCQEEANKLAAGITEMHDAHLRDCGETLMMAYASGNYTKVQCNAECRMTSWYVLVC